MRTWKRRNNYRELIIKVLTALFNITFICISALALGVWIYDFVRYVRGQKGCKQIDELLAEFLLINLTATLNIFILFY